MIYALFKENDTCTHSWIPRGLLFFYDLATQHRVHQLKESRAPAADLIWNPLPVRPVNNSKSGVKPVNQSQQQQQQHFVVKIDEDYKQ